MIACRIPAFLKLDQCQLHTTSIVGPHNGAERTLEYIVAESLTHTSGASIIGETTATGSIASDACTTLNVCGRTHSICRSGEWILHRNSIPACNQPFVLVRVRAGTFSQLRMTNEDFQYPSSYKAVADNLNTWLVVDSLSTTSELLGSDMRLSPSHSTQNHTI